MKKFIISKISILSSLALTVATMTQAQNFDTNFVELDTSKMITTGDSNYAICNHNFPSNWRSVSVNGDQVTIATRDKQLLTKTYNQLSAEERSSVESIKTKLTSVIRLGPLNVPSQSGLSKLTTFDRFGGSSTMGSSNGGSSSSSSSSSASSSGGGMSISKSGKDSFIVYKQDFPFNWLRLFYNEDVVTVVYRDGRVIMLPQDIMQADERAKAASIRDEVEKSTRDTERMANSFLGSFKNPMDFVSRAMGGMFG